MKQGLYAVLSNRRLTAAMMEMRLSGDVSAIARPGQFVNVRLDGFFLRRPISVCDWDANGLTLLYKIVGGGTEALAKVKPGQTLDLLTGLGNGYSIGNERRPALIGGGAGIPPLYALARELLKKGARPQLVLGFNTASEIYWEAEFRRLGAPVFIATADGSAGTRGFAPDLLKTLAYDYFYACGPMPMFRAVEAVARTDGQYSFEERMGCGFGACMGCSCRTKYGDKRLCKDGPVLRREEVIW